MNIDPIKRESDLQQNGQKESQIPPREKQIARIFKALYRENLNDNERKALSEAIFEGAALPEGYTRDGFIVKAPSGREIHLQTASGTAEPRFTQEDIRGKAMEIWRLLPRVPYTEANQLVTFIERDLKIDPEKYLKGKTTCYLRKDGTTLPRSLLIAKKPDGGLNINIMVKKQIFLGAGSYKHVRLAIDYETGKERKARLMASATLHPKNLDGLYKELKLIAKILGKENLYYVLYHNKKTHQQKANFVMPLATEGTLRENLRGSVWYRNTEKAAKDRNDAALSFLEVVKKIHELGFATRDLKPDNVLLSRDKDGTLTAMVTDVGLAIEKDTPGEMVGTALYRPPELLIRDPTGVQSMGTAETHDCYSAGLVLWRLFNIEPFPTWVRRAVRQERDKLYLRPEYYLLDWPEETLQDPLEDLIRRLTSPEPKSRPTIAKALEEFKRIMNKDQSRRQAP